MHLLLTASEPSWDSSVYLLMLLGTSWVFRYKGRSLGLLLPEQSVHSSWMLSPEPGQRALRDVLGVTNTLKPQDTCGECFPLSQFTDQETEAQGSLLKKDKSLHLN